MAAAAPTEIPSPATDFEAYKTYCYTTCLSLLSIAEIAPSDTPERIAAINNVISFMNGTARYFVISSPRRLQLVILAKSWQLKALSPSNNMLDEIKELIGTIGHILPLPHSLCGECHSCCTGMFATCLSHIHYAVPPFMSCDRHSTY